MERDEGSSLDSGSGGIIDVSTVSSTFSAPTPQASGDWMSEGEEGRRGAGNTNCPQSVEKVWFTDTSTGVWLLEEEESGGCEVPEEFLDVSMESGEEEEEKDGKENEIAMTKESELSSDADDGKQCNDSETVCAGDGGVGGGGRVEKSQFCGWVPPQCCLIPLPDSPCDSEDESERERDREDEEERKRLSTSELQREQEKELEILFGYKPPIHENDKLLHQEECDERVCEDVFNGEKVEEEEEKTVAGGAKPRSNSTDSGVVSISPRSSEGDMEQRPNQNVILAPRAESCETEIAAASEERVEEMTIETSFKIPHPPVSRLRTPSGNRSVFNNQPVVSSELEELKEVSKMEFPPLLTSSSSPPLTATIHQDTHHTTFTVTPQGVTSAAATAPISSPLHSTTSSSSSSSSSISRTVDGGHDASLVSITSSTASTQGIDNPPQQMKRKKMEKKISSLNLAKPAIRGTFAYKAGAISSSTKVVKRPPSTKLRSLLPATSSAATSVLPSHVKKPSSTSQQQFKRPTNPLFSQASCHDNHQGRAPVGVERRRKVSAPLTSSGTSSNQNQSVKKVAGRRSLDPVSVKPVSTSRSRPSSASHTSRPRISGPGPIKTTTHPRITSPVPNKTGTRLKPNHTLNKQTGMSTKPHHQSRPVVKQLNTTFNAHGSGTTIPTVIVTERIDNSKSADLSLSIVSNSSPLIHQSTPMRHNTNCSNVTRPGTVTKSTINTTVTKDVSSLGNSRHDDGNSVIPVTPKSSIASASGRCCRPNFSLSSIDSEGGPPSSTGNPPPPPISDVIVESTPKRTKQKRRSFIPTPARQCDSSDTAAAAAAPIPLVYSADKDSSTTNYQGPPPASPVSRKHSVATKKPVAMATNSMVARKRKSMVPGPRPRKPLLARNKMATGGSGDGGGPGKKIQKTKEGPLKPVSMYKYNYSENSEPPLPKAKVVHSPVNKDDLPTSPHSAWSPIRRKPVAEGEACYQCTKRGHRN